MWAAVGITPSEPCLPGSRAPCGTAPWEHVSSHRNHRSLTRNTGPTGNHAFTKSRTQGKHATRQHAGLTIHQKSRNPRTRGLTGMGLTGNQRGSPETCGAPPDDGSIRTMRVPPKYAFPRKHAAPPVKRRSHRESRSPTDSPTEITREITQALKSRPYGNHGFTTGRFSPLGITYLYLTRT